MTGRSLRASAEGIQIIRKAIKRNDWKQDELKTELGLKTRQPITRLLRGEAIERPIFEELCHLLGLNLDEVVETDTKSSEQNQDIESLVEQLRQQVKPYIQERCGSMKVLDMTQPIGLGSIYTDVNILEKITGRTGREIAELVQNADLKNFDRFCLGEVEQERVPALEAVEKFSKLMILGKPGAGKTTFLKHLAMQCMGGAFQREQVPFFITLKEFAETKGEPELLKYCQQWVASQGAETLETLLQAGRVLLLLDGLDEVREADASRVLQEVKQISLRFPGNQVVITCRIGAREYIFEQFTEVEVADFNSAQIADFVQKWFQHRDDGVKGEQFLSKLEDEEPIRELAASPLLLTLLCLVFEDSGSFPSNRAELYGRGVDVLLTKWDAKRNIERGEVYRGLSLKRKEDLLSGVARSTFETENYLFKQREAERLIAHYIQNLPSADPAALEVDSAAVLKSVEAHHGLFVERAKGIYSFSHLTFHEYFAARSFAESRDFAALILHITERRWREVFLLTVQYLSDADELVQLMRAKIDRLLAGDKRLQEFLRWVNEKAMSVNVSYKPAAVRAFYLDLDLHPVLIHTLASALDHGFDLVISNLLPNYLILDYDFDFDRNLDLDLDLARALDRNRAPARNLTRKLDLDLDPELHRKLQALQNQLPDKSLPEADREQWWQTNGKAWRAELRAVMIEHRNIGHDWQFSEEQQQRLSDYYDANKLLVDCLNSECYVSREVRQEIEKTLLLPLAEIERWQATN